MNRITLFEEYRLIERSESEVNGSWKGAHLLLFFLAFVFGSFCTFCFHMLMYLFDEKCVLFPKLISINSVRQKLISDFLPTDKDTSETLPVDFLSTQWVDKAVCYLPTYVPLVSGIFGLVWTTMFLMCSTGSRTLTGLQRPWRVLPPVFIFSLAMGGLCVYASAVTHYGLQELCVKLGEFTGSTTCSYTINVATLAYERRIRGVFQATRLTILSAWLHTFCWLLSALLALVRVLMAVDFQLVKINVELSGDIDKMLERHERQVRTVSPVVWFNQMEESSSSSRLSPTVSLPDIAFTDANLTITRTDHITKINEMSKVSKISLVNREREQFTNTMLFQSVPQSKRFIVKMLYDLLDFMDLPKNKKSPVEELDTAKSQKESLDALKSKEVPTKTILHPTNVHTSPQITEKTDGIKAPSIQKQSSPQPQKSSFTHKSVQTDKKSESKKSGTRKVQISDLKSEESSSDSPAEDVDKETQTKDKEKQD